MAAFCTLKRNTDFRRLYYRGKSQAHPLLVTYAMKGRGGTRVGITVSAKLGGAVRRNRARRIIREAYRGLCSQKPGRFDIVFVARARTMDAGSGDVARVMRAQLAALGVLPQ